MPSPFGESSQISPATRRPPLVRFQPTDSCDWVDRYFLILAIGKRLKTDGRFMEMVSGTTHCKRASSSSSSCSADIAPVGLSPEVSVLNDIGVVSSSQCAHLIHPCVESVVANHDVDGHGSERGDPQHLGYELDRHDSGDDGCVHKKRMTVAERKAF